MMEDALTMERLREVLSYDALTGQFTRKVSFGAAKARSIAGSLNAVGYLRVMIDGRSYLCHRLAWFYETGKWPVTSIDHINGLRSDNRMSNLREATQSENLQNSGKRMNNTSGFKGVTWFARNKKWKAQITVKGRCKHLGYFDTPQQAHQVYCDAAKRLHREFARLD